MQTIYNYCHPEKEITKGLIEIINLYEHNYYILALDGKVIEEIYKDSFETTVLKRSFINPCCKKAGVLENELHFVKIDWHNFASQVIDDYDANDFFGSYKGFINFLDEHGNIWENCVKHIAKGINELEEYI